MPIEVPQSRIDALVRLLGDDDPKICSVAWDNLEKIGEPALMQLEKASIEADDARVRVQSGRFLTEWRRREVFRRWVAFSRLKELDLEDGAFLIAETEHPETDMSRYRMILDGYAQVLKGRLTTARNTDEAVKKLSTLLFHELGFKGNASEYYNPANSYLNCVLDSKRGIPISLAAVCLLTARRVSVALQAVSMPRHFLLKYRGSSHEVFIDVFHSGRLLSARDCSRFLAEAEVPFHEDHFRAVTDREILARMLGNLVRIYHGAGDQRRCDRISAMLKLLT